MTDSIHHYFGLSYGNYLVVPRSVLQSMPEGFQRELVKLLNCLDESEWRNALPEGTIYKVELRDYEYDMKGDFKWKNKVNDPLMDYQRGRRNIFREYNHKNNEEDTP